MSSESIYEGKDPLGSNAAYGREKYVHRPHRVRRLLIAASVVGGLFLANGGPAWSYVSKVEYQRKIDSPAFKAQYGHWDVLTLPKRYRVNAVHAVLLRTGKVLITAGSGNDAKAFAAGTFKSLLWDPATNKLKLIPTPVDLFCSVHAFLPNGRVLIAGGTQRYEILQANVTNAAGAMTVKNESPTVLPRTFAKGTRFVAPSGSVYQATSAFTVNPATKVLNPKGAVVVASEVVVWVEAVRPGPSSVSNSVTQYALEGLTGIDQQNVYGLASRIALDKQDFQGVKNSYVFDPITETYERMPDMRRNRWYPTLAQLPGGNLLAVSGLDETGHVLAGQNEVFDWRAKTWTELPGLTRYFATYPALFPTAAGELFYSGSNSGYGPADQGRKPGLWNPLTNGFKYVRGLRDAGKTETSNSLLLPPAQRQRFMVIGGGGTGESPLATARTDVIDLTQVDPHFVPGPDLPAPTRYPSSVILPDDTVLVTGGSRYYRGEHASDYHQAQLYHPVTNRFTEVAAPSVGRDYHSEALLLPDGRVVTMGSNPLFNDKKDSVTGVFEQRLEIYTPSYLYRGERPVITAGPTRLERGSIANFAVSNTVSVGSARLIRPGAVTHVTDVEQRSIALGVSRRADGSVDLSIPQGDGLVPTGWYMLFVTNDHGIPSAARWVQVS